MNVSVEFPVLSTINHYTQLEIEFEREIRTLFSWMKPSPRPCFNPTLLDEIRRSEQLLVSNRGHINHKGSAERVDFVVFGSKTPGVFNLGGDLNLFIEAIMRQDRDELGRYAHMCVDNVYRRTTGFDSQITSIALIQGKALGGGFESALAADIIVAERGATMSFPEVLFNMFPGMGALSFLTRRIGAQKAEEIIDSGHVYTAKELYDLGAVDVMVEDGLGLEATRRIIADKQKHPNARRAIRAAKRYVNPVTLGELRGVVDVWVDAAMHLETRDLRMMARLVRAQDKLINASSDDLAIDLMYGSGHLPATGTN